MSKVYISGPISGYPDRNAPAFEAAQAVLRAQGHYPVNPIEINPLMRGVDPATEQWWGQCLRNDLVVMCYCDALYMLPNWKSSKGASLEHYVATALGLHIMYQEG